MLAKTKAKKLEREAERERIARLRGEQNKGKRRRGERPETPEVLRKPEDVREDPRYQGQTTLMITWVPLKCQDEKTEVTEDAIREWILFGAVEEDDGLLDYYADIEQINKVISDIDKHLKEIPKLQFQDDDGKAYTEEQSREERARLYELFSNERLDAENDLDVARKNLQAHISWRKSMGVDLRKGEVDRNTETRTWYVHLHGTEDAQVMEDRLILKENWPAIKLACGLPAGHPDNRYLDGSQPAPPWVGRDRTVPDGSKVADPTDYRPLQVNIAGARIHRVPSGVGLYQELDRASSTLFADEFGLYYGEYDSGRKDGYGVDINDVGVFTGSFEKGFRKGRGRWDLNDGTTITGTFTTSMARTVPDSSQFINPYQEGEPNGNNIEVLFADGGLYRGEMRNGRIVGHGDYQSAFNEVMSGYFADGVLDGGTASRGFLQNSAGEVYMGPFTRGELNGQGTYQNARGDSYEGSWCSHLRHGRGVTRLHNAGAYRGYYVNNMKHGKGGLEYGVGLNAQIREVEEKRKADRLQPELQTNGEKSRRESYEEEILTRDLSEFDYLYQGFIMANGICNRGSVMNTHLQVPAIISRLDRRARSHTQRISNNLLKHEERRQKNYDRTVERTTDVELHIRSEMTRKKLRIFNQQKHFAKKTMYSQQKQDDIAGQMTAGVGPAGKHLLQSKLFIRKERLKTMNEENWPYKQAALKRMQHPDNRSMSHLMQAFDRIQPEELQRLIQVNKKLQERNRKTQNLILEAENDGAGGDESVRSGITQSSRRDFGMGSSVRTMNSIDDEGDAHSFHGTDSLSGTLASSKAALERLELDRVNESLLQVLLSDFEEVHERQRFLKYDRIWQRAQDAVSKAQH